MTSAPTGLRSIENPYPRLSLMRAELADRAVARNQPHMALRPSPPRTAAQTNALPQTNSHKTVVFAMVFAH